MHTASRPFLERIIERDRSIRDDVLPDTVTLAGRLEVSPRTVPRDLDFHRVRMGAPLAHDEVRPGHSLVI